MAELTVDRKFRVLSDISRAQHFAYHAAVRSLFPDAEVMQATLHLWEITGEQTARACLKRLDPAAPLAKQVADSIVWEQPVTGEDAHYQAGDTPSEAYVRHDGRPWFGWHERMGILHEDRPGCETRFASMVKTMNRQPGSSLQCETLETLPDGCSSCSRRLWTDR